MPIKNATDATNATKSPENRMQQGFARGYLPKTSATIATNCPENRMQQGFAPFCSVRVGCNRGYILRECCKQALSADIGQLS